MEAREEYVARALANLEQQRVDDEPELADMEGAQQAELLDAAVDDELMFGPFSDEEEDEAAGLLLQGPAGGFPVAQAWGEGPVGVQGPAAAPPAPAAAGRVQSDDEGDLDDDGQHSDDDVLQWTDDEEEAGDTTAEQAGAGRDIQGIPWDRLQFSREHYRETRIRQYRNYVNVLPENPEQYRPELLKQCKQPTCNANLYAFHHNSRAVSTTIVHFQLRNLVWSTSRNDVFVVSQSSVNHWSPATRRITEVMNLSGSGKRATLAPNVGRMQISTLCVRHDLVAAGGFGGELVVKRLGDPGWVYAGRISQSENGITNGLEVFSHASHGQCILAANNDAMVRLYQAEGFKCIGQWEFPWAVNYASAQPVPGVTTSSADGTPCPVAGSLVAVVGDDPVTHLTDMRTGAKVSQLHAHEDFSFAASWHPAGHLLATGNQDTTVVVWDIRKPDQPLARMAGRMGAIRALRWSPDGRCLAASEPADFVHLYSVEAGFSAAQEIDLFGEISGISFTPAGDQLLVGIADITYASLITFTRSRHQQYTAGLDDVLWA